MALLNNKTKLILDLTTLMSEKKYKKNKQTWHKDNSELIIVFNIQNSCYSDDYYVNLGIIIKPLMHKQTGISLSNCHLQQRVPSQNNAGKKLTAQELIRILELWEQWYGDLKSLRNNAIEGKLPHMCTIEAKTFLRTVILE